MHGHGIVLHFVQRAPQGIVPTCVTKDYAKKNNGDCRSLCSTRSQIWKLALHRRNAGVTDRAVSAAAHRPCSVCSCTPSVKCLQLHTVRAVSAAAHRPCSVCSGTPTCSVCSCTPTVQCLQLYTDRAVSAAAHRPCSVCSCTPSVQCLQLHTVRAVSAAAHRPIAVLDMQICRCKYPYRQTDMAGS